ncbi:MAG: hypothetical protein BZ136_02750 [Methanosphaera sp. rholeuAM74]|nr:MAG: hypothetical protein BZ136_02750 [Methanosphaera sp. rholeuAM74]
MKSIKLNPEITELTRLNDFITEEFNLNDFKLNLIVEEIFVNIVNYSQCSYIKVDFELEKGGLTITFRDDGVEFNPLAVDEVKHPDSIEEAEIGGLGIHLSKELADEMHYEYSDNENRLTIIKNGKL